MSSSSNSDRRHRSRRTNLGPLAIIVLTLLVPVLPFIVFGTWMEATVVQCLDVLLSSDRPLATATSTTLLLAADILLPIPSSVVCTCAGRALGVLPGVLTNWVGLNLSSVVGYWLGRRFGPPVVARFANREAIERLKDAGEQVSIWTLVLCRAIPVLAEASVLLAGLQRQPARQFYPPVIAANFGIAVAYAWLGNFATAHGWFPAAAAFSCALPVLLLIFSQRRANQNQKSLGTQP